MKNLITILFLTFSVSVFSQDSLSIFDCFQQAWERHPLMLQKKLYQEKANLEEQNIESLDYPSLSLNGKVSYQSEVTHLEAPQPAMMPESLDKTQYQTWLDLYQTIYQGKRHSKQKDLKEIQLSANLKQVNTELYHTLFAVNQTFFGTLQIQENIAIHNLKTETIKEKIKELEFAVQEGVVHESKLDVLKAEKMEVEQSLEELYAQKSTLQYQLEQLTGIPVIGTLSLPDLSGFNLISKWERRPETQLMETQKHVIEVQKSLIQTARAPILYGFGKAGYGLPGLNMLKNELDPYYLVGIGVSWKITDWHKTHRDKQILALQKQHIETQKNNFKRDYDISLQKLNNSIKALQKQLSRDRDIIKLRTKVTSRSSQQLQQGLITSSDYIRDLNKEMASRLTEKIHQTQLAKEKSQLLITLGDPIQSGLIKNISNSNK